MLLELALLVAIAHVWARGSIFARARSAGGSGRIGAFWRALADCPLCSGFWIGVLGHVAFLFAPEPMFVLGFGALVGTLSLAVYGLIRRI